ncbi:MAG: PAS domain S-box protein, partial [Oscillospiraceae bacterium]|nr:PAS domain S-box protein [Oscillospiraceae bacterium]
CNAAAVALLGIGDKAEYLGDFLRFSPEAQPDGGLSAEEAPRLIQKAFDDGFLQTEWTHKAKNGEPISSEMTLVRMTHGGERYVASYIRDLREQKEMVREIKAAQTTISAMFESNPHINVLFDSSFKVVDCNPAGLRFMGFETKEGLLAGFIKRMTDSIPAFQPNGQPSVPLAERLMTAVREGSIKFETEVCMNGVRMNLNVEFRRIPYESSFAVVGYIQDITELYEHERELLRANERSELQLTKLGTVVRATKVGQWELDLVKDDLFNPANALIWSDDCKGMLGYSGDAEFPNLLGSWVGRIHPDDEDMVLEALMSHVTDPSGETPYDVEYRMVRKDGGYAYFRDCGATMRDGEGNPVRDVGALMDITETKGLISEIEGQNELMRAINDSAALLLEAEAEDYAGAMQVGMGMVGRCLGLNRITVWHNVVGEGGGQLLERLCLWSDETMDIRRINVIRHDEMPGWIDVVVGGGVINGPMDEQPERERSHPAVEGIASILVIPISLNNRFWGLVSFDDRDRRRHFSKEVVQTLHSWGLLAVGSIQRGKIAAGMLDALGRLSLEKATLRTIFDSMPDFVFCKDMDLRYTKCNARMESFFKVSEADLIGKNDAEGLGASELMVRLCNESDRALLETGRPTVSEETVSAGDGTGLLCETVKVPIMDGDEIVGLLGISRDVTERKRAEEAMRLRESMTDTLNRMSIVFLSHDGRTFEDKMTSGVRLIADQMGLDSVSVWRDDMASGVMRTSQTYRWDRRSGGTAPPRPELQNVPYGDLTPHWEAILKETTVVNGPVSLLEHPPAMLSRYGVRSVFLTPLLFNDEHWGFVLFEDMKSERTFDGLSAEAMRSAAFLCANTVIRFEMEGKLKEALDEAMSASRAKSEFLANMSHEIRTPMNAIVGMTNIGKSARDVARKDYSFGKIEDASLLLLGVISDILDMSKIEAGRFDLAPEEFEFERVLRRVVNVINMRVEEKGQRLSIEIDGRIPRYLHGDDQRLAQVIMNLLGNAVKFTPERGAISLSAALLGEDGGVCDVGFKVADDGIGINGEQQARLFQSFQQAESSTSRKYGGTGLGLVISKSIVEMMGGSIKVESEAGKGSVFSFNVRMARAERPYQAEAARPGDWGALRALAVGGDGGALEGIRPMASAMGLPCDSAADGDEAVAMALAMGGYDVYFVGCETPGADCAGLAARIRDAGVAKAGLTIAVTPSSEAPPIGAREGAAGFNLAKANQVALVIHYSIATHPAGGR